MACDSIIDRVMEPSNLSMIIQESRLPRVAAVIKPDVQILLE